MYTNSRKLLELALGKLVFGQETENLKMNLSGDPDVSDTDTEIEMKQLGYIFLLQEG